MDAVVLSFSRPETTGAVTRGAARLFTALGFAPLLEVGLPNGRRADIMALGPRGEIAIVEVKSSPEDYRADRKWGEYLPYCDAFFFAVAPEFRARSCPRNPVSSSRTRSTARCFVRRPPTLWSRPVARP